MKLAATVVLALALSLAPGALSARPVDQPKADIAVGPNAALINTVYQSVVELYREDESGGMHFTCTATVYKKTEKGYRLVSASHCVEGDKGSEQKTIKFFVTLDQKEKNFIPAKLIETGDKSQGDDFSIFEVETTTQFTVTPLGDDAQLKIASEVIDIAAPMGLGKQYFAGYVSSPKVDRPPIDAGEVQWTEIMLVKIGGGPGSSGSAIVSVDQKAIVGFLVGHDSRGEIGFIVVPVTKFKKFEAAVDAGKYKKTNDPESFLEKLLGKKRE